MQTDLAPPFRDTPEGQRAREILGKCVHCGFCTATCPTYQLLGDELDGPRGRIYLIKQVLEGHAPTRSTQLHLDRCLTCRACETTCPSGVQYAELAEIGRAIVDDAVPRPASERLVRWLVREGVTSAAFQPAMAIGQALRPLLPAVLKDKVPVKAAQGRPVHPPAAPAVARHARAVWLLNGCVQPAMAPNIDAATARVLDALGVRTEVAPQSGCCGAIRLHLGDPQGALIDARRNIDAWWHGVCSGAVEAIVLNASGCGSTVKDYGRLLAHDPAYADKAAHISRLSMDLGEWLSTSATALAARLQPGERPSLALHAPCSLQHGQRAHGTLEHLLRALGFAVHTPRRDAHLCCGSAGAYSLTQPGIAGQLRDRKLDQLTQLAADCVVSANIGCIQHLQSGTETPVRHWIELVDEALRR